MSRATNPTRATCDIVDARDEQRCVKCGSWLGSIPGSRHHRQSRSLGDHSPANLVLLCGSGTTGCHGWAHANPREARDLGIIVSRYSRPSEVPIVTWRGTMLLDDVSFTLLD